MNEEDLKECLLDEYGTVYKITSTGITSGGATVHLTNDPDVCYHVRKLENSLGDVETKYEFPLRFSICSECKKKLNFEVEA